MKSLGRSALIAGSLAVVACLVAGPVYSAERKKISVIATFSILADMVRNVGGERVSVSALVKPGSDAHVYRPTPATAAEIKRARVVVENGLGFEGWLERLVASSGYKGVRVVASQGIKPLELKGAGGEKHHGHGHGHESGHHKHDHSDHGPSDPHGWQSIKNGIQYVANIVEGLCSADPGGCDEYKKNAADYSDRLKALDKEVATRLSAIPKSRRKLITSHNAFGYFAQRYGVSIYSPEGVSTESEASAKDVAKLIRQIAVDDIKALFIENVSDARLVEQIARETGLKPAGRLYSDALSREGEAATYLGMMRANGTAIAEALEAGR